MGWWIAVLGVLVVLLALRDIFHTLWHPTRRGGVSRLVMAALWRVSRWVGGKRVAGVVGPLGMLAVVSMWGLLLVLGWALVYLARMPDGFAFDPGLRPEDRSNVLDSFYLSIVAVGTLGYGDVVPVDGWLRVVSPLQALVGFVLLTAVVSWVLGSYPALGRRKALARRLAILHEVDSEAPQPPVVWGASTLESLASEVIRVRVDFGQYPETYYFFDDDAGQALPLWAPYAYRMACRMRSEGEGEVRPAAVVLERALADLARTLDLHFLHTEGSPEVVFDRYREEHARR
ncbi:two pore domain potassium channel family protein [Streptomyces sp. OF3]|uniref:Two pore domain potassium channel family protein n=1 Tax=Streptomyces alkaliterrae TaxID=2213162 RepID=A0A7W3ZNY0_9ACTN|nr:two pore domain potassium channel family protein [Streptomyces alkaliterrae]